MQSKGNGKPTTAASKYAGWGIRDVGGPVSIGNTDAALLRDTIHAVIRTGDAIQFGLTRDGGALAVSIYSGGARSVQYFTDVDMLQDGLNWLRNINSST